MSGRPYASLLLGMLCTADALAQTPAGSPGAPVNPLDGNLTGSRQATDRSKSSSYETGGMPKEGQYSQSFHLISDDQYGQDARFIYARGHVVFEMRGYLCSCDVMIADRITKVFLLEGHATLIGDNAHVSADRLVVDYPNKSYQAFDSTGDLKPKLVGGNIQGDLFVKGVESHGSQNDTFAKDSSFTTCDLPNPHYDIESNDIEVRYGVRAIMRRAQFHLFGKKLLTLPYFVVPLDDRSYRNLPSFGYDTDEGYYVKTRFGIPLSGNRDLLTHLDFMSQLGIGVGADYRFQNANQSGTVSAYTIAGSWKEFTFSNQLNQKFDFGTLTLNDDYEQNNYLSDPGETVFNMRGSLALPQGKTANSLVSFSDAQTSSSSFNSSSQMIGLMDDRHETKDFHTNFNLNYTSSNSSFAGGTSQTNQDANLKLLADEDLKRATLGLEYLRDIPIGQSANFNSGSDITPEVSLTSDAQKLVSPKIAQMWPFHTELSWGDFANGLTQSGQIGRSVFDFSFQKPDLSKRKFTVDFNGEFKQGVYSDDTAEYVLNFGTDMRYSLGKDNAIDLRYAYLRPYGYSPLAIDQTGQTDLITLTASGKPLPGLLTGVQTGYDINRLQTSDIPWQVVGLRTEYSLQNYFALRALSSYDPFQNAWSSIKCDLTYKPGATMLAIGSQFDGVRHTWTNVNISLANLTIGKTRFSTNLAYNGYTQRFDTQQYNVVYDLHCAEAVFTLTDQNVGFRPGRQIEFFIRLKAIPFDGNFGIGTRGQGFSTSTGSGY